MIPKSNLKYAEKMFLEVSFLLLWGEGGAGSLLGFSLVVASGVCSLAAVHGLLVALALPCCEAWVQGRMGFIVAAPRLRSTGSVVAAHELSCSVARGVFPDQGWKPCILHWREDSLPLSRQGSPKHYFLENSSMFFFPFKKIF